MNQHDRDNLEFLLTVDSQTLKDFYDQASADDIAYAQELIKLAQMEFDQREQELDAAECVDLSAAQAVIKRIQAL